MIATGNPDYFRFAAGCTTLCPHSTSGAKKNLLTKFSQNSHPARPRNSKKCPSAADISGSLSHFTKIPFPEFFPKRIPTGKKPVLSAAGPPAALLFGSLLFCYILFSSLRNPEQGSPASKKPPGGKPGGLRFLLGGDHMSALELHMEGENLPMLFR